eukprot:gene6282-8650_t
MSKIGFAAASVFCCFSGGISNRNDRRRWNSIFVIYEQLHVKTNSSSAKEKALTSSSEKFTKTNIRAEAGWGRLVMLGIGASIGGLAMNWNSGLNLSFWNYVITIVIIFCGYLCFILCYSELVGCMPFPGGAHGFVRIALGPYTGFMIGCCESANFILNNAATIWYLGNLIDRFSSNNEETTSQFMVPLYFFVLYLLITLIHLMMEPLFWRFSTFLSALSVLVIVSYCCCTASNLNFSFINKHPSFGEPQIYYWHAIYSANWFYIGFGTLPLFCDHAIEPMKNMPKSIIASSSIIFFGSMIVLLFCLAQNSITSSMLFPLTPGFSDSLQISKNLANIISFPCILVSTFISIFASGRKIYAMSRSGLLPQFLAITYKDNECPAVAIIFQSTVGFIVLLVSWFLDVNHMNLLFTVSIILSFTWYIGLMLTFFVFKKKYPTFPRSFTNPFGTASAIIGMIIFTVCLVSLLVFQRDNYVSLACYIVLLIIFTIYYRLNKKKQYFSPEEQSFFFPIYVIQANKSNQRRIRKSSAPASSINNSNASRDNSLRSLVKTGSFTVGKLVRQGSDSVSNSFSSTGSRNSSSFQSSSNFQLNRSKKHHSARRKTAGSDPQESSHRSTAHYNEVECEISSSSQNIDSDNHSISTSMMGEYQTDLNLTSQQHYSAGIAALQALDDDDLVMYSPQSSNNQSIGILEHFALFGTAKRSKAYTVTDDIETNMNYGADDEATLGIPANLETAEIGKIDFENTQNNFAQTTFTAVTATGTSTTGSPTANVNNIGSSMLSDISRSNSNQTSPNHMKVITLNDLKNSELDRRGQHEILRQITSQGTTQATSGNRDINHYITYNSHNQDSLEHQHQIALDEALKKLCGVSVDELDEPVEYKVIQKNSKSRSNSIGLVNMSKSLGLNLNSASNSRGDNDAHSNPSHVNSQTKYGEQSFGGSSSPQADNEPAPKLGSFSNFRSSFNTLSKFIPKNPLEDEDFENYTAAVVDDLMNAYNSRDDYQNIKNTNPLRMNKSERSEKDREREIRERDLIINRKEKEESPDKTLQSQYNGVKLQPLGNVNNNGIIIPPPIIIPNANTIIDQNNNAKKMPKGSHSYDITAGNIIDKTPSGNNEPYTLYNDKLQHDQINAQSPSNSSSTSMAAVSINGVNLIANENKSGVTPRNSNSPRNLSNSIHTDSNISSSLNSATATLLSSTTNPSNTSNRNSGKFQLSSLGIRSPRSRILPDVGEELNNLHDTKEQGFEYPNNYLNSAGGSEFDSNSGKLLLVDNNGNGRRNSDTSTSSVRVDGIQINRILTDETLISTMNNNNDNNNGTNSNRNSIRSRPLSQTIRISLENDNLDENIVPSSSSIETGLKNITAPLTNLIIPNQIHSQKENKHINKIINDEVRIFSPGGVITDITSPVISDTTSP